jgi:hypothetical protein
VVVNLLSDKILPILFFLLWEVRAVWGSNIRYISVRSLLIIPFDRETLTSISSSELRWPQCYLEKRASVEWRAKQIWEGSEVNDLALTKHPHTAHFLTGSQFPSPSCKGWSGYTDAQSFLPLTMKTLGIEVWW